MDYYSSFIILENLRNKNASTILRILWNIFTIFGPPQELLTDQGTEFLNTLVERFTQESGVQHVITYSYHAQANGKNERSHQVIVNALRILLRKSQANGTYIPRGSNILSTPDQMYSQVFHHMKYYLQ